MAAALAAAISVIAGWFVGGVVWLGMGIVLLVFAVLFVFESLTYFLRQPHITPYVRGYVAHRPTLTLLAGLLLVAGASMALTHFWLDR